MNIKIIAFLFMFALIVNANCPFDCENLYSKCYERCFFSPPPGQSKVRCINGCEDAFQICLERCRV